MFQYVSTVDKAIEKMNLAAKKGDFDQTKAAAMEVRDTAEELLKTAKPPIIFN